MKIFIVAVAALLCLPTAFAAEGTFPVEEGFLTVNVNQMTAQRETEHGIDLIYRPPGAFEQLAKYNKVMIDQPEIWIDPDSKYRGAKPDNLKAIADLVRENLSAAVVAKGYQVVEEAGPDVLYIRVALTDLYLQKVKRGIFAYTPIGFVIKAGADGVREWMSKIDVIEVAIQIELQDSVTEVVFAAIIVKRGSRKDRETDQKLTRYDFDQLTLEVKYYGARLACNLDNSRAPADAQQVDCGTVPSLVNAGYLVLPDWFEEQ